MANVGTVFSKFGSSYVQDTPTRLKIVDAYLAYVLATGIVQFVYCLLVGTFPFNSFLAGFLSCVASFVLGLSLRIQVDERNRSEFKQISVERAFADFILAHLVLHLVVFNFLG